MDAPLFRRKTLATLAESAGYKTASLAAAADVDFSTVNRHWQQLEWPAKARGDLIVQLVGIIPGLDDYIREYALNRHIRKIETDFLRLEESNPALKLDGDRLRAALARADVAPQYVLVSLRFIGEILRPDAAVAYEKTTDLLQAFWGQEQTRALQSVVGSAKEPGIVVGKTVVPASVQFLRWSVSQPVSSRRLFAELHLTHHIAKARGDTALPPGLERTKLPNNQRVHFALRERSRVMGVIRHQDNFETALQYSSFVQRDEISQRAELWAFLSWSGDIPNATDRIAVPESLSMTRTADAVIRQVDSYNEAYVWYLLTTFVPLAVTEVDPDFGGRLPQLREVVQKRLDNACDPRLIAAAIEALARFG